MSRPELRTDRLRLSPMAVEHLPLLIGLDSDAEVLRHVLGRARTAAEAEQFWLPRCTATAADGRGLGWWVGFRDAEFVGWWVVAPGGIDATPGADELAAESGWRLRRSAWGRGLATEGARAVFAHGFEQAGLETVWAEVHRDNAGSLGVVRHLGMTQVDVGRPSSAPTSGELRFEMTRSRWTHGGAGS